MRTLTVSMAILALGETSLAAAAETYRFSATGTLKRSDFGMSTHVPIIRDDVNLTIDAEFNRAP
jgi:polyisoprenoid-binding protein YceI